MCGHLETFTLHLNWLPCSVASAGFASPTVLVFYCDDPNLVVARFKADGFKIAGIEILLLTHLS
jgi:hypothetical protein